MVESVRTRTACKTSFALSSLQPTESPGRGCPEQPSRGLRKGSAPGVFGVHTPPCVNGFPYSPTSQGLLQGALSLGEGWSASRPCTPLPFHSFVPLTKVRKWGRRGCWSSWRAQGCVWAGGRWRGQQAPGSSEQSGAELVPFPGHQGWLQREHDKSSRQTGVGTPPRPRPRTVLSPSPKGL